MPYLEFALHSELINKMKLRGVNALFDLRIQVRASLTDARVCGLLRRPGKPYSRLGPASSPLADRPLARSAHRTHR
jgi:hypothetical protein